jgi:membrane associated rhomboid family serine protease
LYKRQSWYSAIGASGGVSGILFAAVAYAPNEIEVNFLPGYILELCISGIPFT